MASHFRDKEPGVWHAYQRTSVVNPPCRHCGDHDRGGGRRGWRWRWIDARARHQLTEAICGRCFDSLMPKAS